MDNKKEMAKKANIRNKAFSKLKFPHKKQEADDKPNVVHDSTRSYKSLSSVQISHEINKIKAILEQTEFIETYSRALEPSGTPDEIESLLYGDKTFSDFMCYHNRNISHYYAADIAGLGPLQQLLDTAKLPGHEQITDIGFNSNNQMTVETNKHKFIYGNKPGEPVINRKIVDGIISLMTQQGSADGQSFSKAFPLYNGTNKANYLRISATHPSVSPYGATLSIRVSYPGLRITENNFNTLAPVNDKLNVLKFLATCVLCHANMLISAETGAGKTELQKLLMKYIPFEDRIILIEDTDEIHLPDLYPKKDIFSWISGSEKGQNTLDDLIKHALRNNPKWIIVAETRGSEAFQMEQSVKTDHAIITTLHASTNADVAARFSGMIQTGYDNLDTKILEKDFREFMHIGIHMVKRVFHGYVIRYIDDISEFVPVSEKYPTGTNVLFHQHIDQRGVRTYYTNKPSKKLQRKLMEERDFPLSIKEWPIYDKEHPVKEIIYPELYKAYKKRMQARHNNK